MLTSAIVTLFFWNKIEESSQTEKKQSKKEETPVIDEEQPLILLSAVDGKVQDITKSSDAAFASGGMGKGVCIDPTDNMIYAPCDGKIAFTFPTKHALGLVSDQGVEIMIHCGIDTVNMEGEGFETLVSQGEHVHAHTPLIRFDSKKIKAAGNSDQTMMIITNSDQYDIEIHEHEAAGFDAPAITVRKKAND